MHSHSGDFGSAAAKVMPLWLADKAQPSHGLPWHMLAQFPPCHYMNSLEDAHEVGFPREPKGQAGACRHG